MRKPILLNLALDSRARLETSRDTTGAINLRPAKFTTEAQRHGEASRYTSREASSFPFSVSLCLCGENCFLTLQKPSPSRGDNDMRHPLYRPKYHPR
jgi:hypothetical protein